MIYSWEYNNKMCINCICIECCKVKENMKNNIWFHKSYNTKLEIGNKGNLYDLFPKDKNDYYEGFGKPKNVIWGSAGSCGRRLSAGRGRAGGACVPGRTSACLPFPTRFA